MSLDPRDFEQQVLLRSRTVPVLVDFWAPWCGPCRSLGPVLEELAREAAGRWELVKINTEESPDLARAFDISSIPAVKLFVNGEVRDSFVGALPRSDIRRWLDRALPSPLAADLERARVLLAGGDAAEAATLLEPLVQAQPADPAPRVLLAEALLPTAPARAVELTGAVPEGHELHERATLLRTLATLATRAAVVAALPDSPARASHTAALEALARGDFAAAVPAFLESLERAREYQRGEARDALRAIFRFLGPRHPVVDRHFRAFSSALHS